MTAAEQQTETNAEYLDGYRYGCFATQHPYSVNDYERGLRAVNVAREWGVDLSGTAA